MSNPFTLPSRLLSHLLQPSRRYDEAPTLLSGGLPACEAYVAARLGGLLGFLLAKLEAPLLGVWALPRPAVPT